MKGCACPFLSYRNLVGNGLINDCRYGFLLDFFNSISYFDLLQLQNMCAKYWKAAFVSSWVTGILVGNGLINDCRYRFLLDFFNSFSILLYYYSYKICVRNFKRLHLSVLQLQEFSWDIGLINDCRYGFLLDFFNSFVILLYDSYEIHVWIFERLCLSVFELQEFWWEIDWSITGFYSNFLILFYFALLQLRNMCANFWKAASISSWVTGVLVGNGLINDCRYKFSLNFFYFALLQLWNMCTNLWKAAHNCYWITGILAGNGLIIDCRYRFLLNYYFLFFNFVLLQLQSRCT